MASMRVQRESCQRFPSALSSAVSEWFLIFLLFLDGLFSYLVTKFAHSCKLQTPCLLCSRLDHILGREKRGFYKDLICDAHKTEISSLAYCHVHRKLADVRDMCEACLLSFATEKKSNSDTYRSLVGKLEMNLGNRHNAQSDLPETVDADRFESKFQGEDVVQVPLLKKDNALNRIRYCSCCKELFSNKLHAQRLLQTKLIEAEVAELDAPLSALIRHGSSHQDGLRKIQKKSFGSPTVSHAETRGFDCLSHVGYMELKITSDSESEVPFSDEDDGSVPVRETNYLSEEFLSRSLQPESAAVNINILSKTLSDDLATEKLIHTTPIIPDHSLFDSDEQFHVSEHHDGALAPTVSITHGLEELNWNQVEGREHPPAAAKLMSEVQDSNLDELEISDAAQVSSTTSGEGRDHPPASSTEITSEISTLKRDEMETGDAAVIFSTSEEVSKVLSLTETDVKQIQIINEPGSLMLNHMDLNDAYKLAVSCKWSQPSPKCPSRAHEDLKLLLSQISASRGLDFPWNDMTPSPRVHGQGDDLKASNTSSSTGPSRAHEDLKLLLSQISAARGLDFPWNDITPSPRVHGQGDDLKASDTSSSTGLQNFGRRFSIERNESGFESLDGSIVSEIEGENPLDRLKQQVEFDRKSMSLLYKELEEERSASAIAANQAMAMITRLQEEKASMQMEALQYLRMMEEQAEYDQEALQKSNDLLTQKEKEIQDLEAEIESYKKQLGDRSLSEERENNHIDEQLVKRSGGGDKSTRTDLVFLECEGDKIVMLKDSLLGLEDEKVYISECLKRLEKKLHLFSNNGVYADVSGVVAKEDCFHDNVVENGQFSGKEVPEKNDRRQCHWDEVAEGNRQLGEVISVQKVSSFPRQDLHPNAICPPSNLDGQLTIEENYNGSSLSPKFDNEKQQSSSRETDLVAIENEFSCLNERLEALEADRNFLEHAINSLRNGNDGVRFVQEIASHLQELRRIGVRRREQPVA